MRLNARQCEMVVARAANRLMRYCVQNGIHYVVLGVSGGLDSAVTLGIAEVASNFARDRIGGDCRSYNLHVVGVILPCESKPDTEELAKEAIEQFSAIALRVDLTHLYMAMNSDFTDTMSMPPPVGAFYYLDQDIKKLLIKTGSLMTAADIFASEKVARGNMKARLRMMALYHIARMMKGMVLSTDNLSEYWMAFWTLHGDVGDFGMIQNLLKGDELYDIACYLGVPQSIIDAKPDDGLGIGNGDEDQIGAPYSVVDKVMITLIKKGFKLDGPMSQVDNLMPDCVDGVPDDVVERIARRCLAGDYKRKGTIVLTREQLGLPPVGKLEVV